MKKVLLFLLLAVLLFICYLLWNTYTFTSSQLQVEAIEASPVPEGAVDRMVKAISIRTVSFENESDFDSTQFQLFNEFLSESYPLVHEQLEHKVFNEYSHLYKWSGRNSTLKPIILMGHVDVVPIASLRKWTVHPFTEGMKNDTIYGRGTMDDKISVIGTLEAVEQLLSESYQPERTIYLSFGHDEEIGGQRGAVQIAKYLEDQGIEAEMVMDEGMAITEGMIPGLNQQLAFIGIAEKGITTIELRVDMAGGHSSQPAKETAIDVLSSAVAKVKQNPMPARMTDAMKGFMNQVGPEMDFKIKMVFANAGLFKSVLLDQYQNASATGNATVRTTTSPTIFEAGIKENIIPTSARALINFRIIPGETSDDVMAHVNKVVNDERVKTSFAGFRSEPSPVSPSEGAAYNIINKSIKESFPGLMTAPNLVIAATDSRHFSKVSKNIYRFAPYKINPENLACFHGIDERIPVSEFENGIRFYRRVIINAQ